MLRNAILTILGNLCLSVFSQGGSEAKRGWAGLRWFQVGEE